MAEIHEHSAGRPIQVPERAPSRPAGAAADWLLETIGPFEIVETLRAPGRRNLVWRVRSHRGDFVFKLHERHSRWETELYAYRRWVRAITPYKPDLIAEFDQGGTQGLLLSHVEARPLRQTPVSLEQAEAIYRHAGALLRRLHEFETGRAYGSPSLEGWVQDSSGRPGGLEPDQLAAATVMRMREMAEKGRQLGCLSPTELAMMREGVEAAAGLPPEPAIPTHTDFTPGNWLVTAAGDFAALIDFEDMGWGSRADPFPRLVLAYFPYAPECERAFYQGYGEDLSGMRDDQIRIGCLFYAAHYAIAGAELGNPKYRERAARSFERIRGLQ